MREKRYDYFNLLTLMQITGFGIGILLMVQGGLSVVIGVVKVGGLVG
ncbi:MULTISPECIES: hypothetical protein [Dickeya]|nr:MULTISPECIES: hypothetical protein [Dickeya]